MLNELKKLLKNSQSEWTKFNVSSIIVDVKGNIYKGVNIEYIIPTNSICAERNAISTAFTKGMKMGELKEVHILGSREKNYNLNSFTSPCGVCRQAILEASNGMAKIFLYNLNGKVKEYLIEELLSNSFSKKDI